MFFIIDRLIGTGIALFCFWITWTIFGFVIQMVLGVVSKLLRYLGIDVVSSQQMEFHLYKGFQIYIILTFFVVPCLTHALALF